MVSGAIAVKPSMGHGRLVRGVSLGFQSTKKEVHYYQTGDELLRLSCLGLFCLGASFEFQFYSFMVF
jgi:hypothetical protein